MVPTMGTLHSLNPEVWARRAAAATCSRLGQPAVLEQLSHDDRRRFLDRCTELSFRSRDAIFSQSLPTTAAFIIIEGLVRTYYLSRVGREVTTAFWSNGDLIGGPSFFGERPTHIWSAQAIGPTRVLAISTKALKQLAQELPAVALCIIDALSFKLHWVSLMLQTMGTESVTQRLATLLLRLSETYGEAEESAIVVRYPFSQADLASMVGASRPWVSTMFGRLQKQGIVAIRQRHIAIIDLAKLREML
jgi:CRP/FNR family transcriptional regulator, cyclic AMP receptor protein